ncbi:putative sulfate exporter family transporter [Weeksellaceae bacterium A-14]
MQNHNIRSSKKEHVLSIGSTGQKIIFIISLILCCIQILGPGLSLFLGLFIAQISGHPFLKYNHKMTQFLLQFSVVGLGFGMNVHSALSAGKTGFIFTVFSIISTLILGYLLGNFFKTDNKISFLINSGTAICGGSAIAAIAPVIKANEKQISVALGAVFILNALALFIFPSLGHYFNLSQVQFGTWCAIAIHDTSSVVGAASKYGSQALEVATTIKLARAMWIIPVAIFSGMIFKNKNKKIKIPYFIGLFFIAMIISSYVSEIKPLIPWIVQIAKTGLNLTLFLIGAGLSRSVIKSVGIKPLFQAIILWLFIAGTALCAVFYIV